MPRLPEVRYQFGKWYKKYRYVAYTYVPMPSYNPPLQRTKTVIYPETIYEELDGVSMNCPKCNKRVHSCCTKRNCVCRKGVEPNSILIPKWVFFGKTIPSWLGNLLWKYVPALRESYKLFEIDKCPYCGYLDTPDAWFSLSCDEALESMRKAKEELRELVAPPKTRGDIKKEE